MPRKKKKVVSLEVIEINSAWDYRQVKILDNFVCYHDDAEQTIQEMDKRDFWKHESSYKNQVKSILAAKGTRGASDVFFGDDVNVEEINLPETVKAGTKFIYKYYDYTGGKLKTEYGTQKDILAYLSKKIKTKYIYVAYNGTNEKIEFTTKAVGNILDELEKTTSQFEIEPVGRSGGVEDPILVSIFKNNLK